MKLSAAATGKMHVIHCDGSNAVKVYPSTGDKIGAASTNAVASSTVAVGKGNIYIAQDAQTWRVITGA